MPVDQAEDDEGSLASPNDLNGNGGFIVLRSSLPPEQMENALRATVRSIDPLLPLTQVQTMEEAVSQSEAPRRFSTVLIGSFAFAAVLLAVLGIYSVISFSVALTGAGDGDPDGAGIAARGHCAAGAALGSEAGGRGMRDWIGWSAGGIEAAAVASVRREPVRSAGAVGGCGCGVAAGAGGFGIAGAARGVD